MKKLLTLLIITISLSVSAQKKYYNTVVNAYQGGSSNELIELVKGTTLLNYDFTDINGETISTDKVKKPIFIIAAATWSAPFWGAMPALDQIIEANHEKVEFIMLFWDKEDRVKKMSHKINKYARLIPARETDKVEKGKLDISGFIHKLKDYPTGYLVSKNKTILDVARGAASPSKTMGWDEVNKLNLEKINVIMDQLLQ